MTAKIIAIPGVTERFQLNTARSQDLADLEVQLQKVATQIQRIHEEWLEAFSLPESYRISTLHILSLREQTMSGGVDKVAFEAIEYIAGAVYIAFDRIHSVTRETSRKEISYEEQVTVAIQGFLLLPSSEANHDFRNMCLTQAQRWLELLSRDPFYMENFPWVFSLLAQRSLQWLPHLRQELQDIYIPETHLRRVK